jgi:hypothetical protein
MTITGDRQLLRVFEELPARAQERVAKPLLREAAARVALVERDAAPAASGLLRMAIGVSTLKSYASGTLFIATGVRRGFRRAVQATSRGKLRFFSKRKTADSPDQPVQNPTKYLHLVTGGRRALEAVNRKVMYDPRTGRFFGKSVRAAAPNPFMSRAFESAKSVAVNLITSRAPDLIDAEVRNLANTH